MEAAGFGTQWSDWENSGSATSNTSSTVIRNNATVVAGAVAALGVVPPNCTHNRRNVNCNAPEWYSGRRACDVCHTASTVCVDDVVDSYAFQGAL